MKSTPVVRITRLFAAAFCIVSLSVPQHGPACSGSRGPVCTVNPAACLKSMVLTKSVPGPIFPIPAAGVGTLVVSNNLFIVCPQTNNCGGVCTNVGVPVSASLTLTLSPPAPPFCPAGSPALTATISTAGGTMALPLCSPFGTFNPYLVTIIVPGGTCPGLYTVVGTATVTFSDGTVLTQTGDTAICLVPEAPGQPGVPRLDMQLLTPSFPRIAPGDVHIARYLIKNNDPSNSVSLTAFATSRQAALRPQGANEANGVFSIATPFGDDFPIAFLAASNCIPLPTHPYTQPTISNTLPVIPPGGTNIVQVGIRSYGQCNSGSCSESILRVQGTFSDSSAALGCASMAVSVDTSLPSTGCASQVNDCNHNGIPDPLDIILRISQDQNFNGVPDECEGGANGIPYFSSVSPNLVGPGAPIQVQVAFQETFPFSNVWANGSALTLSNFFGSPLWYGTIPADTRPGPQTVYFLGKDTRGILSSYIALYQVIAPPTITQQPQSQTVPLNGNGILTVVATGDPVLNYQWRQNGAAIAGATSNSFPILNAQPFNAGTYDVIVSNPGGTVFSSPAIVKIGPSSYKIATVPTTGQAVTATLTETEEDQGLGLKCIIPNAQWLRELDWGITETTPTNGVSSLSDLLLLRNEGNNAVIILFSDNSFGTPISTATSLLIASANTLQFMGDLLVNGFQTNTVKITLLEDDATFSDTLIVTVVPQIPTTYKIAEVPPNGVPGTATLTESEEDAGIALKCYIRNARWVRELDWGLTETTVTNGVSSLSDVLMLRNEGPDAAVILLSDNSFGTPTPPRPNVILLPSAATLNFVGDLVLNGGPAISNTTAKITLLDDNVNLSDTLIVQIIQPVTTTYKTVDVPTNGAPVAVTLTESEELAGYALKAYIRNAQWVTEQDWGLTETTVTNGISSLSDVLLLRNEGPNAVVILLSDASGPLLPPRPNPILVASAATQKFQAELLVLGGTNTTANITVLDDDLRYSDTLIVQVTPRIPLTYKVADVPTNGLPGTVTLTENEELAGLALKCIIRNAQWVQERDWGLTETTVTNGISSLSDVLLLRNEGPDAAVILISDATGVLTPPRPNPLLVASAASLQFQAELLILGGTNTTANITLLDDNVNFSDTLIVQVVPRIPPSFKVADVPTNGLPGIATLTESEELAGITGLKCYIRNAQWVQEQDWGITETTVTNGVSSLSDVLLLRNEGPDAVVILISDATGPVALPRPGSPLVASAASLKFQHELLILGGTNATANITLLDDDANFSDTLIVQVVPRIPPIFKVTDVPPNGQPGILTLTENEELAGITGLKCYIRNAQWVQELDWGITETTVTNGISSLSDALLLRNEGPDAVVILISDANGPVALPRPNSPLVASAASLLFQSELLVIGGTNTTASIKLLDDDANFSDTLIVQVVPRIPTTYKVADVPTDGTPGVATLTESEEGSGVALKCVIRNAQWVQELDWGFIEATNRGTSLSDLLLLRNEGPDAVVILYSDNETGLLVPARPNTRYVLEAATMRFQAELLVLGGTNTTANITVQNDIGGSDVLTVQVVPRIPTTYIVADVPTNGIPGTVPLTQAQEDAGTAIKCFIRNAQWVDERDWAFFETTTATNVSDLLLLRNEGPDAVVIFYSDSEFLPPIIPPRADRIKVVETPLMRFQAELLILGGTNATADITVQNDADPTTGFSDILTVQVIPRTPPTFTVADVPTNGVPGTISLTQTDEDNGTAIKCVIRNAQWFQEADWVFLESSAATNVSDLLLLRNEGPDAAVIFISDSETGPGLIPPRPNYRKVLEQPAMQFQADFLTPGGLNRTAKITVQNDLDPTTGFSDTLTVQIVPLLPPVVTIVPGPVAIIGVTNTPTIDWSGFGVLQTAPSLLGPWADLSGAENPFTIQATAPSALFRVRVP